MNESQQPFSTTSQREISLAVQNAIKLMASFVVTIGVAFVVRFWIPRFLGPEGFGLLHFSEQFAITMFFIVTFGTDVYIRKEVAQRPEHASDFFGGLLLFRLGLTAIVAIIIALALHTMNKDPLVWKLVYTFSIGQMFFVLNTTLGAILEARGTIGALAAVNAAVKIMWGAGCVGGLLLGMGPMAIAISFLFGEAVKVPVLYSATRKYVGLQIRFNSDGFKTIVVASLPYCINYVALGIYSKIGVTILSALTNDKEVGWLGAATNITFIIFLFVPILRSVLMPMGARIAQDSTAALNKTLLATIRIVLMVTVPMAALLALNASVIIEHIYTNSFESSIRSLQIISPLIPLSFSCTISGIYLIQLGKVWTVAKLSVAALAVNLILNALLIPPLYQLFGDGGGGIATALSLVITEMMATTLYFRQVRHTVTSGGRRIYWLLTRLLLACGIVAAIAQFVASHGLWAILIEIASYCILGYLLGVLPVKEFLLAMKNLPAKKKHSEH